MAKRPFQSEQFQEAFWDLSPIPLSIVSRNGTFISCNPAWTEMLGYARSELEGMHFRNVTHPADAAGDEAEVARLLADPGSTGYSMVKRYIHKQGTSIWVELHVRAVRDTEGQLEYFAVCVLPLPVVPVLPKSSPEPGILRSVVFCFVDLVKARPRECLAATVVGLVAMGRIPIESVVEAVAKYFGK